MPFGKQRIIEQLIASHAEERRAWAEERASLLDRIQAPEVVLHREAEKADPIEPEPVLPGPFTVVFDEDDEAA